MSNNIRMRNTPDPSRRTFLGRALGLTGLALLLSQCPDKLSSEVFLDDKAASSDTKPKPGPLAETNRTAEMIKEILASLKTGRKPEDHTDAYLPDPETRDQYVNEAVACLEDSGKFACARTVREYSSYECLPLEDYENESSVPLRVHQTQEMKCWDTDLNEGSRECELYYLPKISLENGLGGDLGHGYIDFDRSRFDRNKDSFCEEIFAWTQSHPASADAISAHCADMGILGKESVTQCYKFQSAWNELGLNAQAVQEMSETLFDQLDEGGFEFEQDNNGSFKVWIDGEEFPVSLISDGPNVHELNNYDPFRFEILPNGVYLDEYAAKTPDEMTELLNGIREEMEDGE